MREEIIAGLRNAIERGQSIQQAMQSMINAGYQASEIQEASNYVNLGATGAMQQVPKNYIKPSQTTSTEQTTTQTNTPPKSSSKTKVIVLSIILFLLLIGVGITAYFMLKP